MVPTLSFVASASLGAALLLTRSVPLQTRAQ